MRRCDIYNLTNETCMLTYGAKPWLHDSGSGVLSLSDYARQSLIAHIARRSDSAVIPLGFNVTGHCIQFFGPRLLGWGSRNFGHFLLPRYRAY